MQVLSVSLSFVWLRWSPVCMPECHPSGSCLLMPQSHPTTGPVQFSSPVRFLARKSDWSACRNLTLVLFSWSHKATGPVRLDTAVYLWFGWIIRKTPRVPRAMPVRAPYGNLQWFSYPTGPVRGPCVTRKVRRPYGHAKELTQPELAKIPHGRRILPYGARTGPLRSPHGLFTGCSKSLQLYGARKLIMHALKLYGPRTGRQNSYGAAWGPCGPREWTYDFCLKQPVNSPRTACTGPGSVMWLRHNGLYMSTTNYGWLQSGTSNYVPYCSLKEDIAKWGSWQPSTTSPDLSTHLTPVAEYNRIPYYAAPWALSFI